MPNRESGIEPVFLDACCLVNLYATGKISEILRVLPFSFATPQYVVDNEATYVLIGGAGEDAQDRTAVDLTSVLEDGLLTVVEIETDAEAELFIQLAADLDDGEARTIALAAHRGGGVGTDDRKARSIIQELKAPVRLLSTLELLHSWALITKPPAEEVRQTLRHVRERGRFLPPRNDSHRSWWEAHF